MPSAHDDNAGPPAVSTPRSAAPGTPGKPGPAGARSADLVRLAYLECHYWLGDYMAAQMTAAGIDAALARRVADEMQSDILAAFATMARLDHLEVLA